MFECTQYRAHSLRLHHIVVRENPAIMAARKLYYAIYVAVGPVVRVLLHITKAIEVARPVRHYVFGVIS
ncbi:hypothetical protein GCM10011487_57150 [Steroidobacter agaridevorans]|uniref:Uncharacterized protein n=1 Tax=Steroidobacter agaridevorans TaxID=2695856 RepID=A0A829YK77_9GAMM|nr:hypothetical protein GCM10011487_57150 [Steroidobacter agaridevorans]